MTILTGSLLNLPGLLRYVSFANRRGGGDNPAYPAYGPQLGHRLRLSHTEQNLVGLSGNCTAGYLCVKCNDLMDPRSWRIRIGTVPREARRLKGTAAIFGYLLRTTFDRIPRYKGGVRRFGG